MNRPKPRRSAIRHAGAAMGLLLLLAPVWGTASADTIIYNDTAAGSNDFVPFENDGTPNRPVGDHLGNQITFAAGPRYLDHVQVVFASIGPKELDTYTLDLYKNDGPIDPSSGLASRARGSRNTGPWPRTSRCRATAPTASIGPSRRSWSRIR